MLTSKLILIYLHPFSADMTKSLNSIKLGLILFGIIGGLFIAFLFIYSFYSSNTEYTLSETYNSGDIPTSYLKYDSTCNVPSTLEIALPEGDSTFHVSGIDISYSMTALGNGKKAQQKSQVFCYNTNKSEPEVYSGIDSTSGKMEYFRKNVDIANGSYPGGTTLKFSMHAWRTFEGVPGCNSSTNRVDATSWKITVHYTITSNKQNSNDEASSFFGNSDSKKGLTPPQLTCTDRNRIQNPAPGTIIWCTNCGTNGELQMWNGNSWKALVLLEASTARDAIAIDKENPVVKNDASPSGVKEVIVRDLPADTIIGTNFKGPYGRGKPTLFSLSNNAIIPNGQESTTSWDLAFSATTIKINNGTSGPGIGGAFVYSGNYDALSSVPAGAVFKTDKFPYLAIQNAPGMGWYKYDYASDLITPIPGKVLIIRTANGKYAKLEILNYYKGGKTPLVNSSFKEKVLNSRYYTFRYTYQPDGTMNFK